MICPDSWQQYRLNAAHTRPSPLTLALAQSSGGLIKPSLVALIGYVVIGVCLEKLLKHAIIVIFGSEPKRRPAITILCLSVSARQKKLLYYGFMAICASPWKNWSLMLAILTGHAYKLAWYLDKTGWWLWISALECELLRINRTW